MISGCNISVGNIKKLWWNTTVYFEFIDNKKKNNNNQAVNLFINFR